MDFVLNLLRLIGLICLALLGIVGSGFLTGCRLRETTEPDPSTDPTERNTES